MFEKILPLLSASLVAISIGPLLYRTWQGKVEPAFSSWLLWSVIGLVLLMSYVGCGNQENILPSVLGWINPTAMTLLLWQRRTRSGHWLNALSRTEKTGGVVALLAVALWFYYQTTLPIIALTMALVANTIAAWPTIKRAFEKPDLDRPISWTLFTIGFALSTINASEGNIKEWLLPAYMTTFGGLLATQLLWHRLKMHVPIREWV